MAPVAGGPFITKLTPSGLTIGTMDKVVCGIKGEVKDHVLVVDSLRKVNNRLKRSKE